MKTCSGEDVGIFKPDPKVYQLAVDNLTCLKFPKLPFSTRFNLARIFILCKRSFSFLNHLSYTFVVSSEYFMDIIYPVRNSFSNSKFYS